MKRLFFALVAAAATIAPLAPARAADVPLQLFVNGRTADRVPIIQRDDSVYMSVGEGVRIFNGLVTFSGPLARVTVGARVATFRLGSRIASINGTRYVMTTSPFRRQGSFYVPLAFFVTRLAGSRLYVDGVRKRAVVVQLPGRM